MSVSALQRRRQTNRASFGALLLGVIGLAFAPAAVFISDVSELITLRDVIISIAIIPTILGLSARSLANTGRLRSDLSLGRIGGRKLASISHSVGTLGFAVGIAATIALAVYVALLVISK